MLKFSLARQIMKPGNRYWGKRLQPPLMEMSKKLRASITWKRGMLISDKRRNVSMSPFPKLCPLVGSGGSRGGGGGLEKKNHVKTRDFYLFGGLPPPPPWRSRGGGGCKIFNFRGPKKMWSLPPPPPATFSTTKTQAIRT